MSGQGRDDFDLEEAQDEGYLYFLGSHSSASSPSGSSSLSSQIRPSQSLSWRDQDHLQLGSGSSDSSNSRERRQRVLPVSFCKYPDTLHRRTRASKQKVRRKAYNSQVMPPAEIWKGPCDCVRHHHLRLQVNPPKPDSAVVAPSQVPQAEYNWVRQSIRSPTQPPEKARPPGPGQREPKELAILPNQQARAFPKPELQDENESLRLSMWAATRSPKSPLGSPSSSSSPTLLYYSSTFPETPPRKVSITSGVPVSQNLKRGHGQAAFGLPQSAVRVKVELKQSATHHVGSPPLESVSVSHSGHRDLSLSNPAGTRSTAALDGTALNSLSGGSSSSLESSRQTNVCQGESGCHSNSPLPPSRSGRENANHAPALAQPEAYDLQVAENVTVNARSSAKSGPSRFLEHKKQCGYERMTWKERLGFVERFLGIQTQVEDA